MTLWDLLTHFRRESGDMTRPFQWSDPELLAYANEAQREACRRARLLVDSTTAALCSITVTSGQPVVMLDARVIFIRRAKLATRPIPIGPVNLAEMDECSPGWESHTGEPYHYLPDYETGKIRLYPSPDANNTLTLTVVRLPLADMVNVEDSPEINTRFHSALVNWMLYRAFSKRSSDAYDPAKAALYLGLFEIEFGARSSAKDEVWIGRKHGFDGYEGLF